MAVDTELRLRIKAIKEGSGIKDIESELSKVQKQVNELNEDRKSNAPAITEAKNRVIDLKTNLKAAKDLEKSQIEEVKQSYKNASTEKKSLDRQAEQQRKTYDKDRANAIKENERLNSQAAKNYEKDWKDAHKENEKYDKQARDQRQSKFSNSTGTPDELKKLRFEMALVGNEQAKLVLSGQRESAQYQKNKVYLTELRTALQSVRREMQGLDAQPKMTWFQKLQVGESISSIYRGVRQMTQDVTAFFGTMINKGAELTVFKQNSKLTAEGLELIQKAVAHNLDNNQIYSLYNQFDLLKVGLEDTAKILAFTESRFDIFEGDLAGGSAKLLDVIAGRTKGLKSLRLDTNEYNKIVKQLVTTQHGQVEVMEGLNGEQEITIKNLEPEIQMNIRKEALLQLLGVTLQDVKEKQMDVADTLNSVKVATKNAETEFGSFIANGLVKTINALGFTSEAGVKAAGGVGVFTSSLVTVVTMAGNVNLALMGTGKTATSIFGKGGVWITAILATVGALTYLYSKIDELDKKEFDLKYNNNQIVKTKYETDPNYKNPTNQAPFFNDVIENLRTKTPEEQKKQTTKKNQESDLASLRQHYDDIEKLQTNYKGNDRKEIQRMKDEKTETDKLISSKEKLLGLNKDTSSGSTGKSAEEKAQDKIIRQKNQAVEDYIASLQIEKELLLLNKNTQYGTLDAILKQLDAHETIIQDVDVTKEKTLTYWRFYKQLTDDIKKIEDDRKESYTKIYKEQIDYINANIEGEEKLAALKVANIKNEYLQKKKLLEVERDKAIHEIIKMKIDSDLSKKLIEEQNKKFATESKKLTKDLKKDLVNAYVSFFEKSLSLTERLTKLLGIAPETFVAKFIGALREGLGIIQDISEIIKTIKTINLLIQGGAESGGGLFGFFKTLLGLGSVVATGGATAPLLGFGGNAAPEGFVGFGGGNRPGGNNIAPGIIKSYSNMEKSSERSSVTKDLNATNQKIVYVEVPYIGETRVTGSDIEIVYRKEKRKIDRLKN